MIYWFVPSTDPRIADWKKQANHVQPGSGTPIPEKLRTQSNTGLPEYPNRLARTVIDRTPDLSGVIAGVFGCTPDADGR